MKMLDSKVCVVAGVLLGRVDQLLAVFRVDHPNLIMICVVSSERQSR